MKYIVLVLFLPLFLTGCILSANNVDKNIENKPVDVRPEGWQPPINTGEVPEFDTSKPGAVKQAEYDLAEIAKHNSQDNCWLLINDKIYDVTDYIAGANHPGGAAILEGCGKANGTELFETRPMGSGTSHSEKAHGYLDNFFIANLKK